MCFFNGNTNESLEAESGALCKELDIAIGAANSYLSNRDLYVEESVADLWLDKYNYLLLKVDKNYIKKYKRCSQARELRKKYTLFLTIPGTLKENIIKHNNTWLLDQECNSLCDKLDEAIEEEKSYFTDAIEYIDENIADSWLEKYSSLFPRIEKNELARLKKSIKYTELKDKADSMSAIKISLKTKIGIHNKKVALELECNALCDELQKAINEERDYFIDLNNYIEISMGDYWINKYSTLRKKINNTDLKRYAKCLRARELELNSVIFLGIPNTIKVKIVRHNDDLAKRQIEEGYRLIGEVEGKKLDKQQMLAVVKPSNNHLIIAGAGTGKTTTIVGKIKYILAKGNYKPEEILVLSFTNSSASEMSERINSETKSPITAYTFHKLGLEIIKAVEGNVPKIYTKSLSYFVREQLKSLLTDSDYLSKLCKYALFYKNAIRTAEDFSSQNEYLDYLSSNVPKTIKGEVVKSYGELDIANFLYQNQINYEYEASYKFDTNTPGYGQYHPDFYLPEYDLYIEYFGINRDGKVADFFTGKDCLSATEAYQESIKWKRKIHKENQTTMVECYAYEKFEDDLLTNLEIKLTGNNVALKPLTIDELWNKINEDNKGLTDGIIELFGTVISLIKSNNYSFEYFKSIVSNHKDSKYNLYILSLIEPIYEAYNRMLKENNEIDFNDMINCASSYVREGKYINPYKFVIVDEYQDISKSRFTLLNEMRKSSFYELFCVGDDWQSIYRFAGSDINYIVDFEKYWGPTEIGKIETTYRFTNSLIDISSGFIMQNPRQLKKTIRGKSTDTRFSLAKITGYYERFAIQFMIERLEELSKNSTVFFLGRYSFDLDLLKDNSDLKVHYDNVKSEIIISYYKRTDLKMKFMTVHKSKGLQADYVFIINNKDSKMGFPSKIQDASIMDLLLEKAEVYPFAEERRLFYVALTRAKYKVFLVTINEKESIFVQEMINRYEYQINEERFTCPDCGGKLIKKTGPYGDFYGCSNYGSFGCTFKRQIKHKNNNLKEGFS